jgi:hypothetical protein
MNVQVREFAAASSVQHVLHRDYETRGVLQLQKVGVWKYGADDHTEVLCCAFCVDNEPVKLWLPGDPVPAEFLEAANDPTWLACAGQHRSVARAHGLTQPHTRSGRCT